MYEDGIKAAMKAVDDLRTREAGNFKDSKCQGQRGQDRSDALYDAYQLIKGLLPGRD